MTSPRPPSRAEALRPWGMGLGLVLVVVALEGATNRPPRPRAADAPASEFSEARAQPVMRHLAEDIGRRIPGTPAHREAADYLAGLLRELPRVEVEVQDPKGFFVDGDILIDYRTRNVLARLPGRSPDAVLLSAHYDSAPEGSGAADDALGIAAMIEVARALASGPQLEHSVIFNFNGAEEYGLLGAVGFMGHPWARQVRAFVNLEATGLGGRAILFQAGPDAPWLLEAYARAVPTPFGNVVGQDLFQNELIPADTDGHVYRDARIPGLDLALFEDGYAVHSPLDRVDRVEPGSLQHMGDSALAVTRELLSRPFPSESPPGSSVYYDVLGLWLVHYSTQGAWAWAAVATLLVAGVTVLAARRRVVRSRAVLEGFGFLVLSLVASWALPVGLAFLPSYAFGSPHGWYSAPWLAVAAFGGLSVTGALLPRAGWARRLGSQGVPPLERRDAAWLAGLWLWVLVLGAMQGLGLGTAYFPLGWTLGGALGLMASCAFAAPRARRAALYAGWLPGLVLSVQLGHALLALFIPVAGHIPSRFPLDPLVALLVALPVGSACVLGLAPHQESTPLGRSIAASAAVSVAFLVALILHVPYSPERPKRLLMEHRQGQQESRVLFSSWDFLSPLVALSGQAEPLQPVAPKAGFGGGYETLVMSAALPAPTLTVLESRYDEATALRTVRVRLEPSTAYLVRLRIGRDLLAGSSFAPMLPHLKPGYMNYLLDVLAPPAQGREFTLLLKGRQEVPVDVQAFFADWTPALEEARARLPAWTTANLRVSTYNTLRL